MDVVFLPGPGYLRQGPKLDSEDLVWAFLQLIVAADDADYEAWATRQFATDRKKRPKGVVEVISMTEPLTPPGYEQTKEKLADLERRLAQIDKRTDLDPEHLASVRRSYRMMMREYLQEIKLYEAKQGKPVPAPRS